MDHASLLPLLLAYLRNMQLARKNGQADHAAFFLNQAELLSRYDHDHGPVQWDVGVGLHAGNNPNRQRNEDYVFAERSLRLLPNGETIGIFVVADGMGGGVNGQEASRLAVSAFIESVYPRLMTEDLHSVAVKALLVEGIRVANEAVYRRSKQVSFGKSMGTTFVAVVSVGAEAYIASIGDSRVYLYHPEVGLRQLTHDHSYVADLLANGLIEPMDVYTHPKRNVIYRSLGEAEIKIDEPLYLQLLDGDILLLCSDGLWEMVRDPQAKAIQVTLANPLASASDMADRLVQLALYNGGGDNISALVAKVQVAIEEMNTIIPCPSATGANNLAMA